MLALSPKFEGDWNYGNAVHDANMVLGRIALLEGEVEKAKDHLIAAGTHAGSINQRMHGPNMSLAKDLLEKGEREVVLEYFQLCRKFWPDDEGKLAAWTAAINQGQIPNFGPNLLY